MRLTHRALIAALALLPLACNGAESPKFQAGVHYQLARTPQPAPDPKKVEVTEVFWFGCPHCFHFDPYIEKWAQTKPADVVFDRVPASLGRADGIVHSEAFYTAEMLGLSDRIHHDLFNGIHEHNLPLTTQAAIAPLFAKYGISPEEYNKTMNGFAVDARVRRAEAYIRDLGVTSVPTVVVGGKYWSNATIAGGNFDKLIEVLNFLVDKVRKERKS